jgi:pimeloyl-ACP methyl ester carboxylesterase
LDVFDIRTREYEQKYIAAYERTLALWATPCESVKVPTRWGSTHVIACGSKDAPPLVLLHGMNLSATMWFPNVPDLSRHHRIYAVDTIGSAGKSVAIKPLKSRADCAGWLGDVLDGLEITRTHMLGHSHGGWLALNYALSASERVKRLILLAPAASLLPLASQFYLRGIPAIVFPCRSLIARFMNWMTVEGFVANELFVEQLVLGMQGFRFQIRVFPTMFADEALRQLKVHTLLLIGEKEVIYDPEAAVDRARKLIRDVEAELIPNASHGLSMEQPDLVNERILSFLDREQEVA